MIGDSCVIHSAVYVQSVVCVCVISAMDDGKYSPV